MSVNDRKPGEDRKPDYVAVTYIAAPLEKVWAALTNPRVAASFFGAPAEIGAAEGGAYRITQVDPAATLDGRILVWEPPRRLRLLWSFPSDPPPDEAEFLLDPAGDGVTRLMLHEYHGRAWSKAIAESGIYGWGAMLAAIKTYAETGALLPPVTLKGPAS